MKKLQLIKSLSIFLFLITFFSCSEKDRPDGDWDDNIKLSQKKVPFSADRDSIVITTKGEWWWINEVMLNGNAELDRQDVNTADKQFILESSEFMIERKNATELQITMTANPTDTERVLFIGLQAGNYFDSIILTQAAP
ncbi:hypothetical protein [Formosa haliotis]|uniref:hypothetical protein n=1 Tax=Formosa haliotis TaxID=1555194 RepID=UPI000826E62D|nr:hypothetical protein [Formosa haliotis]